MDNLVAVALMSATALSQGVQTQDGPPEGAIGFEVACEGTYQVRRWAVEADDSRRLIEETSPDRAFARLIVDVSRQEVWLVDGVGRGENMLMSADSLGWDWLRRNVTFGQVDLARTRSDAPSSFYRIITVVANGRGGYWYNDTLHEAETETIYQTGEMLAECSRVGWRD